MSDKRIRVAIIGLSTNSGSSWSAAAHLPYFLSPPGLEKFRIVALLNSSATAARDAIATFKLPADTKAYGDPDDLAKDTDIDLVVCNVRVDRHYETTMPSARAGKDVFVEWPLAQDHKHAVEMASLVKQTGARSIIGLQGRTSPVVDKIKDIIASGRIGDVLNSKVTAHVGVFGRDWIPEAFEVTIDRALGGNTVTIIYGHMIDNIHHALGEFKPNSWHSYAKVQRPKLGLISGSFPSSAYLQVPTDAKMTNANVPDILSVHGMLTSGAFLSVDFRSGPPFPGMPVLSWTIAGTTGELRIINPSGYSLQELPGGQPITIELHDYAKGGEKVDLEVISWKWTEVQEQIESKTARLTGELYERYWADKMSGQSQAERKDYPDFEAGMERMREVHGVLDMFDGQV